MRTLLIITFAISILAETSLLTNKTNITNDTTMSNIHDEKVVTTPELTDEDSFWAEEEGPLLFFLTPFRWISLLMMIVMAISVIGLIAIVWMVARDRKRKFSDGQFCDGEFPEQYDSKQNDPEQDDPEQDDPAWNYPARNAPAWNHYAQDAPAWNYPAQNKVQNQIILPPKRVLDSQVMHTMTIEHTADVEYNK